MVKAEIFGIVGGMGPLASAEFVKTIYESSVGEPEQATPIVLLNSDPTFPDRTQALLAGDHQPLLAKLIAVLNELRELGASRIVICCVTIHYLLPKVPPELSDRIISLPDLIFELVAESRKRHLLISTIGARQLGIYEQHARWEALKDRVVLPDAMDQRLIHDEIIYQIKRNRGLGESGKVLESLLTKYGLDSFIAGCTEIHLLAKHFMSSGNKARLGWIDPLMTIARNAGQGRLKHAEPAGSVGISQFKNKR